SDPGRACLAYRPDVSSRYSANSSALAALSTWPAAQGSGPGGLGAGPHGGLPDTCGRRTPLSTGAGASVGALAADPRAVPAAVASSITNSVGVISRGNTDATSVAPGETGVCQIRRVFLAPPWRSAQAWQPHRYRGLRRHP